MARAIKPMKVWLSRINKGRRMNDSASSETHARTLELSPMESLVSTVFNQAIIVPTDVEPSGIDVDIYTSTAVFNLAIAHDLFNATADTTGTNKAEQLYSMVLKLLDEMALNTHIGLVLKLACINNLSQIRHCKGDYKNLREGLDQVSYFMSRSPNQVMFERPDIQGLLMNVLLLKPPVVALAA